MSTTEKKYHSSEWFMPCLLMRLTDQNPQDKRETISQIVDLQQLKQDILQNISMLMNSRSHIVDQNLLHDPYLGTSVLAYGLSDHCGCNYEQATLTAIEEEITRQIQNFEPRIKRDSVKVTLTRPKKELPGLCVMEINGKIEANPLNQELVFRTQIKQESGNTILKDQQDEKDLFRLLS